MCNIVRLAGVALALTLSSFAGAPASAANIVFVSAVSGNDGTCTGSTTSPCRTLGVALSKAFSGDVIQLETGGNYFGSTITNMSITIYSPHGAGIFGGESPCLNINVRATDVVTLDGIQCVPAQGNNGIVFNTGEKLRIRNSSIHGAGGALCGVLFQPNSGAELFIEHSIISENGTSNGGGGVCVAPRAKAVVSGVIDRLTSQNNRYSLRANGNTNLLVQNSIFSNNFVALSATGAASILRISNDSIYKNNVGLQSLTGGQLISVGDNVLVANTTNGAFTSTEAKQ
jgi:hypothetical protein